jgi:peroxiredoxin
LVRGLFSGEIGSISEGPKVGEKAPDFTLRTADGKGTLSPLKNRPQKPLVLIFGSFT